MFPSIVSEYEFINISLQILFRREMIYAYYTAL